MKRENILVKVSGDVFLLPEFIDWIARLAYESHVVICIGGGTQIKEEFKRRGWKDDNYGPLGRETKTAEEHLIAREILESNKAKLKELFAKARVSDVVVVIPMLNIGGVSCHVNGDQYLLAAYLGFDRLYAVTLAQRAEAKQQQFAFLPKIQVKAF